MAKTRTSFQKGQVGNPKGRKVLPANLKEMRQLSYEGMIKSVATIRAMTVLEINEALKDKNRPISDIIIMQAYKKGDPRFIKDFEDRLFGKATDNVNLSSDRDNPLTINIIGVKPST